MSRFKSNVVRREERRVMRLDKIMLDHGLIHGKCMNIAEAL